MPEELSELAGQYGSALRSYLAGGGEEPLMRGGTLGRRAMSAGLGVLEMVVMHHRALAETLERGQAGRARRYLEAASVFLCEALSAFEITHKGFREATDVTRRVLWLASVVSHELKTPLTGVLSSAGMLRELLGPQEGSLECRLLDNVLTSAGILKVRTDELADLVGLQTGSLPLRLGPVSLSSVVLSVTARMEGQVQAAGMRLVGEVSEELPMILGDSRRLDQVLANLIENAVKYGSEGGRVEVRACERGETLVLEVQDYGAGISLWDRLSLFQPYFRGGRRDAEVPGVGLGLALCRQIVQLHHGTISVETEEGRGSLFRVTLPLRRNETGGWTR